MATVVGNPPIHLCLGFQGRKCQSRVLLQEGWVENVRTQCGWEADDTGEIAVRPAGDAFIMPQSWSLMGCADVRGQAPTWEGLGAGPTATGAQTTKRPRRTRGRGRFIRRWEHADDADRQSPGFNHGAGGVHLPETEVELTEPQGSVVARLSELGDLEFLVTMDNIAKTLADLKETLGHMEQEAYRRMEERGASSIPSETFICELALKASYDQIGFTALKEIFNDSDLERCLTPAHTEEVEVPDKWATSTVKSLATKYGADALRIVDRAKTEDRGKLIFKLREQK